MQLYGPMEKGAVAFGSLTRCGELDQRSGMNSVARA